ncbi:MAG TPA: diguanylate cyclase [Mycobacteriales bacterium]|nr:diguanylate cyclase [Mycobacteriales bacterium]
MTQRRRQDGRRQDGRRQDDGALSAARQEAGSGRASPQELVSAFDNAPIGVAIVMPDGTIRCCNDKLAGLLGRPAAELLGTTLFAVTHPEDLDDAYAACRGLAQSASGLHNLECRLLRPDGTAVWVSVSTSRVDGSDAHPPHLVMHVEDIDERKALQAELVQRALHDSLTGLPNRALLLDRIGHALDRGRRGPSPTCVFFLDLDGFKAVNDTYGHAAGDAVLQQLAQRLTALLRSGDTAARIGGDEFVVLCEDTDVTRADLIVQRLREAASSPFLLDGQRVTLSATVGVSTSRTAGGPEPDEAEALLHRADLAMYDAKRLRP